MKKIKFTLLLFIISCSFGFSQSDVEILNDVNQKSFSCDTFNLQFRINSDKGIKKVVVYHRPVGALFAGFYDTTLFDDQNLVFDSIFNFSSLLKWEGIDFKIETTDLDGLVFTKRYTRYSKPTELALKNAYANTFLIKNLEHNCAPIIEGDAFSFDLYDPCGDLVRQPGYFVTNKNGDLLITLFGDDPSTEKWDGPRHMEDADILKIDTITNGSSYLHLRLVYDSTKSINDTIVITDLNKVEYWPLIKENEASNHDKTSLNTDFGLSTVAVTKSYTFYNNNCYKSYHPMIDSIVRLNYGYGREQFTSVILNDSSFSITFSPSESVNPINSIFEVYYHHPEGFENFTSTPVRINTQGRYGDYYVTAILNSPSGVVQSLSREYTVLNHTDSIGYLGLDGSFSLPVVKGWSGEISIDTISLTPQSYSIQDLQKDTVLEFNLSTNKYTPFIFYVYKDFNDTNPVENAKVYLRSYTSTAYDKIFYTDSLGRVTDSLPYQWHGEVIIEDPLDQNLQFNQSQIYADSEVERSFYGLPFGKFTLRGRCLDLNDVPLEGISVFTNDGDTTYTDSTGYYTIYKPYNWNGTIETNSKTFLAQGQDYIFTISNLSNHSVNLDFLMQEIIVLFYNQFLSDDIISSATTSNPIDVNMDGKIQVLEAEQYNGVLDLSTMNFNKQGYEEDLEILDKYFSHIKQVSINGWVADTINLSFLENLQILNGSNYYMKHLDLSENKELSLVYVTGSPSLNSVCLPEEIDTTTHAFSQAFGKDDHTEWLNCKEVVLSTNYKESKSLFNVFPNPATDFIQMPSELQIDKVLIYNISGRLALYSTEKVIDVSSLEQGIYFIDIKTNIELHQVKFIKE